MILLISQNPLFREIIRENLAQFKQECLELDPEEALNELCQREPEIIIIDELIDPPCFEGLLRAARTLLKTQIMVVNPQKDEIVLLDSRRTTLKNIKDFKDEISQTWRKT